MRKGWTENPSFSGYFDDVYLGPGKCRRYHSELCLDDLVCGANPTVPVQGFNEVNDIIPRLALLDTDKPFRIVSTKGEVLVHSLPKALAVV